MFRREQSNSTGGTFTHVKASFTGAGSVSSCSNPAGGVVELGFDKNVSDGVNIYAKCRDEPEEIGLFGDEVVVNCAP
jgi:hypothetical protein